MEGLGISSPQKAARLHHGSERHSLSDVYLNKVRLRTWDHFPVIVNIEGRDVKTKKVVIGWAGWIPRSEAERSKF